MPAALDPMHGEEIFNAPRSKVYLALTDLDALKQNIPDLQSCEIINPQTMKCVVRPGFSFIRGTMKLTIHLAETTPDESIVMKVNASGIGLTMDIESRLYLTALDGSQTRLAWQTQVTNRTGLILLVGPSLIQGAAEKTIREGWQKLRGRVEI